MLDTVTFPVVRCAGCCRDVVAGYELDEDDELSAVCTRCGAGLGAAAPRMLGAAALSGLGYELEGGDDGGGCGSGGCGACARPVAC